LRALLEQHGGRILEISLEIFKKKSAQLWNGQFYDVMLHAINQRIERNSVEEKRTICRE
jgi:hypothetical protein